MKDIKFYITDSWQQIARKVKKQVYPIGARKTIELCNGQQHDLILLDYRDNHAVFGFATLIARMPAESVPWPDSKIRQWLNTDFLTLLPEDFKAALSLYNSVSAIANNQLLLSADLCFLPSAAEVFGPIIKKKLPTLEGQQFLYFSHWENRTRGFLGKNSGSRWMTRTLTTKANGAIASVKAGGQISSSQPDILLGVCPSFLV